MTSNESDGSAPARPDADLESGLEVGEYVVRDKIGEGGFGSVYRAEHPLIGKQVAIKVLAWQFSADPEMVSRFVAEARSVNQIRHRNIIDIFSFGQLADGRHYYIMELLAGRPLDEYLDNRGALPLPEALPILVGVARAVDAAHGKGIAHRDLKPENVFLLEEKGQPPFPKLLDFGIAKLMSKDETLSHKTRTGAPMGTPLYMSPEQCRGKDVDHRTDIYAFGIMTYRMLVGRVPFDADNYMDILFMQMNEAPIAPSQANPALPAALDEPILWMLRKDSDDRPANLSDAVQALSVAGTHGSIDIPSPRRTTATHDEPSRPASGPVPRVTQSAGSSPSRKGWIVGIGAVLAAGIAALISITGGSDPVPAPRPAAAAPAPAVAPAPQDAAPSPAVVPEAPTHPTPRFVTIQVEGPPTGTEVFGPGGAVLGVAPGPIQLAPGDEPIVLTLRAEGYQPASATVTPSGDQRLQVEMERRKPKPQVKRPRPASRPNRNSIESPF